MPTPATNYTVNGENFSIPVDETEAIDPTVAVFRTQKALDNHEHTSTRGLPVGRLASSVSSAAGVTLTGGGLTISSGGVTVTAGGITITAGGLTITAGNLGVGGAPDAGKAIYVQSNTTLTGTSQYGVQSSLTGSTAATAEVSGFVSTPSITASVTTTTVAGFHANNPAKGSGSTIATAYGFLSDTINIGSSNYGFYGVGSECAFGVGNIGNAATVGFLDIPSGGGSPTGVPAQVPSGLVAMRYDSSLHKLWVYDSGWKGIVLT